MWTCWDVFRSPDRKLACPPEGKLACYLMGSLHAKGPEQKCADEQSGSGAWRAGRPSPWSPTDARQLARSDALERADPLGAAAERKSRNGCGAAKAWLSAASRLLWTGECATRHQHRSGDCRVPAPALLSTGARSPR